MTPAEIAEDLRHLADDVGMTDAETADKIRALRVHIEALRSEPPDDEVRGFSYPAVPLGRFTFGAPDPERELSLLLHIIDLVANPDEALDLVAVGRMSRYLNDRFAIYAKEPHRG